MKQLSDLLDEAKASAPPARYDVEDAVAAGRRLQRRRNAGWAVAAVVAVSVAIGVPQIATRHAAPPVQPVVTTTTTAPAAPKLRSFAYPFAGYTAGRFQVDDLVSVTLSTAQSTIRPSGDPGSVSGYLTVFRPGVVSVGDFFDSYKSVDNPPINGRRAVLLEPVQARPTGPTSGMAWEYTPGGWVFVWSLHGHLKRADLTQVVKRLPLGPNRVARLPFRTTYVPKGYRLIQVDGPGVTSGMHFASPTSGVPRLSESGVSFAPDALDSSLLIRLTSLDASDRAQWPTTTPVCPEAKHSCYRSLDGGRYLLRVSSTSTAESELLKTLKAITVADPDDQGTWTDVNSAAPESAQLPAD
jgi:hypothetical protein